MAVLNKGNSNATFQIDAKVRRILMTTWVGEAWERFTGPEYASTIFKCFQRTGCLLTADGSDDHEVRPCPGMTQYTLRDVNNTWFMKYIVNTIIDGIAPNADTFTCATNDDANVAAADLLDDDTLTEDDDIGHRGPFAITASPHWTKVLHPMTPKFRSSMVKEKAFISHKFDNIGWELGQIKGFQNTGAFKGHFSVYYKSDKTTYYHALLLEEYGEDKSWVALVQ
jgi:hypothetical protein